MPVADLLPRAAAPLTVVAERPRVVAERPPGTAPFPREGAELPMGTALFVAQAAELPKRGGDLSKRAGDPSREATEHPREAAELVTGTALRPRRCTGVFSRLKASIRRTSLY